MLNNEADEIAQFEQELSNAQHPAASRTEIAIYILYAIYVASMIYMPLSTAFRWWPT